jgi:hypothetical protein
MSEGAGSPKIDSKVIEKLGNKLVAPNFWRNSSSHLVLVGFTSPELPLAETVTATDSRSP